MSSVICDLWGRGSMCVQERESLCHVTHRSLLARLMYIPPSVLLWTSNSIFTCSLDNEAASRVEWSLQEGKRPMGNQRHIAGRWACSSVREFRDDCIGFWMLTCSLSQ